MEIHPVKDEAGYERALERVNELMDTEPNTPEGDELDILVTLIEAYEEKAYPVNSPDPIEAIRFRMEQNGMSNKDLEPYIGSSGRVSEILNYRRSLSIRMIRNLSSGLKIPLENLINPVKRKA